MLADQMIDRIEFVHSKSCLHRDIKPAKFLMGRNTRDDKKKVFIADFGLARMYKRPSTDEHIPCRKINIFVGTSSFASLNAHFDGKENKPYGKSKVHDSSSISKGQGIDAADSIITRAKTPEEKVSVMTKEDRLQAYKTIKRIVTASQCLQQL
ncbi:uncharacterized protein LOC107420034 isoform X2 [Ziziphus jujuba]|uniref:Uncharacterized protein LOC107420034 isoform X2 n=1 Tax=Ziziphus jujuba TaxID=326968 RepID=A0ABM3ILP1_ZIZJJ|nr:uncharacterized protein LOC107420034 isoform X2 [Ziziphus jujuba]